MSRAQCKELAKSIMRNNWIVAFVVLLIYAAIAAGLSTLTAGIGSLLFTSLLLISVYNVFINAYHGKGYEIKDMLESLQDGITNRICLSLLKTLYIFLWTCLFIIPGIVKSYSYYLAELISRKNPNKTATECIDESRKLMDGHKWELFVFQLSFIGWHLLAALTFGIAYIWIAPYIMQSTVIYIDKNIYKLLPEEKNEVEGTAEEVSSSTQKYCHSCGKKLSLDATFCDFCGTKQHTN